jgi:hypothetical protein
LTLSLYALVVVERRFLGAFFVLLWLAVYGFLLFRVDVLTRQAILAVVLCVTMIELLGASARVVRDRPLGQPAYETVAEALHAVGLKSGDRLALVGNGVEPYYARVGRLVVVAQIPDADEFWGLSASELNRITERLAKAGVRALVARDRLGGAMPGNWRDLRTSDSTRYSILRVEGSHTP